jgi:hypothetical protein
MPPNDDVERPRASSAAERQKSIVSMTEFEGMDEYTALQKYILFYRDTRTNPHAEKTTKKKAWWQFWKSGSATAADPIEDSGAVPDERKLSPTMFSSSRSCTTSRRVTFWRMPPLFCSPRIRWLDCAARAQAISSENARLRCRPGGANQGRPTYSQQRPHRTIARRAACEMSIAILQKNHTDFNCSDQHPASLRSHLARRGNSS